MPVVQPNRSAIDAYGSSEDAKRLLAKLGGFIAVDARAGAPKDTGAGAASIDYEVGEDSKGAYVRVSWSKDRFYMMFVELGTSKKSARPFLRPAATKRRAL
jgi:HK97 gp10 family phage protein